MSFTELTRGQVEAQFEECWAPLIGSDEKLRGECENLCSAFNYTPENLKYKWESISFKPANRSELPSQFDMSSVAELKASLQTELSNTAAKRKTARSVPLTNATVDRTRMPKFFNKNAAKVAAASPLVKSEPITVDLSSGGAVAGPSRVRFEGPKSDASSMKNRGYRYMYEKISERGSGKFRMGVCAPDTDHDSSALDNQIEEYASIVCKHYGIDETELGDPNDIGVEAVVVGRIVHDAETGVIGGKLTEATLTIEASRYFGKATRVSLRFEPNFKVRGGPYDCEGVGLFPGAMVALKGTNGGGGAFQVNEIFMPPPLPLPQRTKDETDSPFIVAVACGPYTSDKNLECEAWKHLRKAFRESKPAVIILSGPFLDSTHTSILCGDIDLTPDDFFRQTFIQPLRTVLDSVPGSIAILIPSVRDIISTHAVYPQSELEKTLAGDPRIHMIPNPGSFSLNSVKFGATSVDVVFHLRKEEFTKSASEAVEPLPAAPDDTGKDSMANLCRHVLQQRSFYPIFPVPADLSSEVNLDVTHSDGLRLTEAPDVLILPSRLRHFSKTAHATTIVNPSFASKSHYALLNVDPSRGGSGRVRTEFIRFIPDQNKTEDA